MRDFFIYFLILMIDITFRENNLYYLGNGFLFVPGFEIPVRFINKLVTRPNVLICVIKL